MSPTLEIFANGVTTISIFLAGRNSVHTWWTGIIGCILFACLFAQTQLYADVVLQVFFVATSAIGWWQWLKGQAGHPLAISRVRLFMLMWMVPLGIIATLVYGGLLHAWTNAYAPFIDSAVLVFSVIAQLLLMQRRLETWMFWLLVNSIAIPLYASRGLHLTAVLYSAYWVNAIVAWFSWRRQIRAGSSHLTPFISE